MYIQCQQSLRSKTEMMNNLTNYVTGLTAFQKQIKTMTGILHITTINHTVINKLLIEMKKQT